MASFEPAYKLERKHEGYYVNNPADKGGETYAGVARKIHGTWTGFNVLDRYKASIGRALKTNEQVPGMEPYVEAFYKNLWDKQNFGSIVNQDVANIVYDWYINSGGSGIKGVQNVLKNTFGKPVTVDGSFGPQTATAINAVDSAKLNNAIKERRIEFYKGLVAKDPTQQVFFAGWMNRINSFPTLSIGGGIAGLLLIATALFFLTRKERTA
jgi:lysozyme family protein